MYSKKRKTTTSPEATADVFAMALQSLTARERKAVVARLLDDPKLRDDVLDIATIRARQDEPARPIGDILKDLRRTTQS